jgi:hypothetical protein
MSVVRRLVLSAVVLVSLGLASKSAFAATLLVNGSGILTDQGRPVDPWAGCSETQA